MGIGHAATRDFVSFLKHADKDDLEIPIRLQSADCAPAWATSTRRVTSRRSIAGALAGRACATRFCPLRF